MFLISIMSLPQGVDSPLEFGAWQTYDTQSNHFQTLGLELFLVSWENS